MWVFLRKNGSFVELRHQGFIAFFVVDQVFYSFMTIKGVAHGENQINQQKLVKRVRCKKMFKCFDYTTSNVPFSEIKCCGVVPSF